MKRHWHVLYGTMIIFFIACAIAIPNQALPWVSTAIMTCTAMMWHRAQAASWQAFVAMKAHAACWRGVAYEAMYECVRDEETNRDMHALKLHEITPADFLENSTPTSSPIDKALAEMYRHARPHTRPLIQNDHHDERS
ncbi:MAG: hypothetical protein E6Y12_02970 [Dermabacter sp.]|nr:hypothetical protein [Dermabacter sp.]